MADEIDLVAEAVSDDEELDAEEAAALEQFMSPVKGAPDGVHPADVLAARMDNARMSSAIGIAQVNFGLNKSGSGHWAPSVYKVLKQVHPDMGISKKAMVIMSDIMNELIRKLYREMVVLAKAAFRAHFEAADVQSALAIVMGGELAKHARSELAKAVSRASKVLDGNSPSFSARMDTCKEDGLVFNKRLAKRVLLSCAMSPPLVQDGTIVGLTAAIEYYCAEILELSGNAARDNKRARINPRHIMLAIYNDSELEQAFRSSHISAGGVIPLLHPVLLPKKRFKH